MTRKELDAICRVLSKASQAKLGWVQSTEGRESARQMREHITHELARELNDLSGNFRRDKFFAACGVTIPVTPLLP